MSFTKPWLWLPTKFAHDLSPYALSLLSKVTSPQKPVWQSFRWRGLEFKNRLGIAGGVDKNGTCLKHWWHFGVGFVEVGTVTPRPQAANSGQILRRQVDQKALWNKMGFPNNGAQALKTNLQKLTPFQTPVFINIGKNRDTSNEKAHEDYTYCLNEFANLADAFVINISSPNTENLRELQESKNLELLLSKLQTANTHNKPLLLKISPDCTSNALRDIIDVSLAHEINGWIISNTTKERIPQCDFPSEGGMSGAPLAAKSKKLLEEFLKILGDRKEERLVISVGGVSNKYDVEERLKIGADLVQVYSTLVFQGPFFFKNVAQQMS